MKFHIDHQQDLIQISFIGDLDLEATELFEEELIPKVKEVVNIHGVKLDLSEVPFVDSTGVGLLIHFVEELKALETKVKLENVRSEVYELFSLMQVGEILGIEVEQGTVS
ncbi:STAS domain-containing protein [Alkalibacillus aidingensis]|uniref:STAS domain-containing protein n=1 Tax=Alkalibacillus aidingensis TaxID=2747607 RepID=UPI00166088C4|nr:STAS domain-containing protein [Alkalibacillus aidingensis]